MNDLNCILEESPNEDFRNILRSTFSIKMLCLNAVIKKEVSQNQYNEYMMAVILFLHGYVTGLYSSNSVQKAVVFSFVEQAGSIFH